MRYREEQEFHGAECGTLSYHSRHPTAVHVFRLLKGCPFSERGLYNVSQYLRRDKQRERKREELIILVQTAETRCSVQLVIAALNEEPGIGLTIA